MAGITLSEAEARLTEYQTAEAKVLQGQAYSKRGRSFTRADLQTIREGIEYWDKKCLELSAASSRTGITVRGASPYYVR